MTTDTYRRAKVMIGRLIVTPLLFRWTRQLLWTCGCVSNKS